jgi:hypothetical protein
MNVEFLSDAIAYDGSQLRAHWILGRTGLVGEALVAFRGPCEVLEEEIADLEDLGGPGIAGADMIHFLWERFDDAPLETAILRQRLLSAQAAELLRDRGVDVRRDGDDLWVGDGKLSISIATRTAVSTLIHFALNVSRQGTPVKTASLTQQGVDAEPFARALLDRAAAETASITAARAQVRAKGEASEP